MNHTDRPTAFLARLALLTALALHLAGAALGSWAHAEIRSGPGAEAEAHPGQLHAEGAEPSHAPCAFCLIVGQPTLAAPPAPALSLRDRDDSAIWASDGVTLLRVATTDQARAPPLLQSVSTDRA